MSQQSEEHPMDVEGSPTVPTLSSLSARPKPHAKWQNLARPLSNPQYRPLKFWFGATLDFKILECVHVLDQSRNNNRRDLLEKVAMHFDAWSVLEEASDAVTKYRDQVIKPSSLEALQTAINRFRDSIYDEWLQAFTHLPKSKPSMQTYRFKRAGVEQWFDKACAFAFFSRHIDEAAVLGAVTRTFAALKSTYDHYMASVDTQDTNGAAADSAAQHPPNAVLTSLIEQIDVQIALAAAEMNASRQFRRIVSIYRGLCLAMDWSEQSREANIGGMSKAFRVIWTELANILMSVNGEESLKTQNPDQAMDVLCEGWSHHLVTVSRPYIQRLLLQNFASLRQIVGHGQEVATEAQFTKAAELAVATAFSNPPGVCVGQWGKYAPQMLDSTQFRCYINKLQYLHAEFQDRVYPRSYTSRLWLAVWRGLKATYLLLRQGGFTFHMAGFPAETTFFHRATVLHQFELVLSGPEALYPEVVENLVAEYCILIDQCLKDTRSRYTRLRLIKPNKVGCQVFDLVNKFAASPEWSEDPVRSIEKCAMALNTATGGPSFLRRWDRQMCDTNNLKYQWSCDKATNEQRDPSLATPDTQESSSESTGNGTDPLATPNTGTSSTDATSQMPSFDTTPKSAPAIGNATGPSARTSPTATEVNGKSQSRVSSTESGGMNVLSAFDYVKYPFPETRALEVAQSRQISREMSDPSLYSKGVLAEDVVNVPPRHTWTPGQISIWAQYLPIGPFDVLKSIWSEWRVGNHRWRKLRKARNAPRITPRKPRREHVGKHPRALGPQLGRNNRVTRPLTQPQHSHVPRLRGGGGASTQAAAADPTRDATSDGNSLDEHQQNARTLIVIDRLRGCWRGGEMLTNHQIRELYLIPNNWNVNAAHSAAIRSLNQEIEGPAEQAPHQPNRDGEPPQTAPFAQFGRRIRNEDPFTNHDDDQSTRSAPESYRLSSWPGPVIPWGRRGLRAQPTTPSPIPRRRRTALEQQTLDPVLPAHQNPRPFRQNRAESVPFESANRAAVFTTEGLPGPFKIYEDPPDRQDPLPGREVPQRTSPAPNQDHQRQIERQEQGLPTQGTNDNDSNQENQSPQRPDPNSGLVRQQPTQPSASPPRQPVQTQQPRCQDSLCHPCPQYNGLFHHICSGQKSQNRNPPQSPHESGGNRSELRWFNPSSSRYEPTSPDHPAAPPSPPRPRSGDTVPVLSTGLNPTDGDNRPPLGTLESNPPNTNTSPPADQGDSNPEINPSSHPPSPQPSPVNEPAMTVVGGHSLRSRTRLASQRAGSQTAQHGVQRRGQNGGRGTRNNAQSVNPSRRSRG